MALSISSEDSCCVTEGAIVLVDEIEHGLEPHRVMGAISQLRGDQARAAEEKRPIGQVLITTHSEVALGEAGAESLHDAHRGNMKRPSEAASADLRRKAHSKRRPAPIGTLGQHGRSTRHSWQQTPLAVVSVPCAGIKSGRITRGRPRRPPPPRT